MKLKSDFIRLESNNLLLLISNVKNFMCDVNKIVFHVKNGLFWDLPKRAQNQGTIRGPKNSHFWDFFYKFLRLYYFFS
jgi:hypothetical protein